MLFQQLLLLFSYDVRNFTEKKKTAHIKRYRQSMTGPVSWWWEAPVLLFFKDNYLSKWAEKENTSCLHFQQRYVPNFDTSAFQYARCISLGFCSNGNLFMILFFHRCMYLVELERKSHGGCGHCWTSVYFVTVMAMLQHRRWRTVGAPENVGLLLESWRLW